MPRRLTAARPILKLEKMKQRWNKLPRFSQVVILIGAVTFLALLAAGTLVAVTRAKRPTNPARAAQGVISAAPTSGKAKPIFAMYYMWWDRSHWTTHLGPNYPSTATPNPLPAALDSASCSTKNNYAGNLLTDVSQGLSYDQTNPQTIDDDVNLAQASGLSGFAVNWIGDGTTTQSVKSSNYNKRLAYMFDAVHKLNAAGKPFKLILNYQSSAKKLPMEQFTNDLDYFNATYGTNPALDHTYSIRPEVIMAGTWKYSDTELTSISNNLRSRLYLIGDEKPSSWTATRSSDLDGTSYYWSSQNPYANAGSFKTLSNFAATVRATHNPDGTAKTWFSPFTPGYNAALLYHTPTCVPRNGTATMHRLFDGNSGSNPDGWTLISWNEISEGSYIVPLTRYGTTYTDELRSIVQTNK